MLDVHHLIINITPYIYCTSINLIFTRFSSVLYVNLNSHILITSQRANQLELYLTTKPYFVIFAQLGYCLHLIYLFSRSYISFEVLLSCSISWFVFNLICSNSSCNLFSYSIL